MHPLSFAHFLGNRPQRRIRVKLPAKGVASSLVANVGSRITGAAAIALCGFANVGFGELT
jgi:hypothetical protein